MQVACKLFKNAYQNYYFRLLRKHTEWNKFQELYSLNMTIFLQLQML